MSKRILSLTAVSLFVAILLSLPLAGLAVRGEASAAPAQALTHEIASSDEQFSFKLTPGEMSFIDNAVTVSGLGSLMREPGAPQLPYYQTMIAVPPGATASATVVVSGAELQQTVGHLQAAPQQKELALDLVDVAQAELNIDELGLSYEPDNAIYGQDAFYPAQLYTLSEPAYLRDLRVVSLQLFPLRYNPAAGAVSLFSELTVTIQFHTDAGTVGRALPGGADSYLQGYANDILNFDMAAGWRHTVAPAGTGTVFPTGIDTYRIEVNTDGIHELSYADLQSAGMDVANVDPATLQMMYRGNPVAYQFIGDADNQFESDEAVRFFGEAFDSSRYEEMYDYRNYYWIWAGGSALLTGSSSSEGGQPAATNFRQNVVLETDDWYSSTSTNDWDDFPNEPDSFYMDNVSWTTENYAKSYTIALPNPDTTGSNADVTAEFLSRFSVLLNNIEQDHGATVTLNNDPNSGSSPLPWKGVRNENATASIPAASLLDGDNSADIVFTTNIVSGTLTTSDRMLVNEIRVAYDRLFVAQNDQLIFAHEGQHAFTVSNLSTNVPADLHIWEITNPLQPVRLDSSSATISGSGPYSVAFGDSTGGEIAYLVATEATIIDVDPADLVAYNGPDLDPASGADWIAISHSSMLTAANNLATHRANALYGGLATHVVDVQDVYNQYGYGFAIPTAIQDYLSHALAAWPTAPGYVVLIGDANINPENHDILDTGATWWDEDEPNYVVTDFQFVDRVMGLVPSDHTYSTLIGADLAPDIAVGRLAAQSNAEAQAMVDKIILYELNGQSPAGLAGHDDVVFVADDDDEGGRFCEQNEITAAYLPDSFTPHHLCLPEPTQDATDALIQQMKTLVNSPDGISLLNYRGHGVIQFWASPKILDVNNPSFWLNTGRPPVILSLDCLDGNFAIPGLVGLGETVLGFDGIGTAGHWSSTGLGFSYEHELLATGLYKGLFGQGLVRFGDATNYSKSLYWQANQQFGYDVSELYSFTLQGDPAMHLFRSEVSLEKQVNATVFDVGDPVTLTLTVENNMLYPAHLVISDTMPAGVSYLGHSATTTATLLGPEPIIALSWGATMTDTANSGIPAGAQATLEIYGVAVRAGDYSHTALLEATGYDLDLSNNEATVAYEIMGNVFFPLIKKP